MEKIQALKERLRECGVCEDIDGGIALLMDFEEYVDLMNKYLDENDPVDDEAALVYALEISEDSPHDDFEGQDID